MNRLFLTGTIAVLLSLSMSLQVTAQDAAQHSNMVMYKGAIIRGDTTQKNIALVFTADEFGDGAFYIPRALKNRKIQASFFFTGNFYRNPEFKTIIQSLKKNGHYLGSHSDQHLLYCDWEKRDSLLVTEDEFRNDLQKSYDEMAKFGIGKNDAPFYLPPYEWYNDTIAKWTKEMGLQLVNFSPGTRSNADYTYPEMGIRYVTNHTIMQSIINFEKTSVNGLNGFILLVHFGTDPRRTDKFYHELTSLIRSLKTKGYNFVRIDELLPE